MLITGIKGDYYHKLVLNKILKEGTKKAQLKAQEQIKKVKK